MDSEDTGKGESKFNFYLVALNFSVLGLAIQTFTNEKGLNGQVWEPLGWVCLLVSGLCALSYVEWAAKQSDRAAVSERLLREPSPSGA